MDSSKKIKVFSFAKFQSVLMALLGLLAGIIYSFGGLIIDAAVSMNWITTSETPGLSYGTILAFGALIGMPLIFATIGFVGGIMEALLFNIFSKWLSAVSYTHLTLPTKA